ncbi:MAG: hypothetical protein PHG85_03795 [Candidatus Altiarchaeota archaeon]|nr:hypothetical protein [Candidatus Altiarchaeota archaeon]
MASKYDEITAVLKDLKERHPEICACMVAKKGLEGVVMFPESFKVDMMASWEPVERAVDGLLNIISGSSVFHPERAYLEMLGYGISFHILSNSDTALILFFKSSNMDVYNFLSQNNASLSSSRGLIVKIIEAN